MTEPLSQQLRRSFSSFDQAELIDWLSAQGMEKEFEAGTELMRAGGAVRHVPLVLSGSIKVSRQDAEGREIFLYYIRPGETCAMTLSACYKGESSRINAVTQEASRLFLLPAHLVHEATRKFPAWQRFAFESFGFRYEELLQTLESVVFQQLDQRLKRYLLEKSAAMNTTRLQISQQQIADDLNASREIISRLIKQFESKGFLRHARGVIDIFSLV
jgi:CRP/FNR family transcriptional regulator